MENSSQGPETDRDGKGEWRLVLDPVVGKSSSEDMTLSTELNVVRERSQAERTGSAKALR